ncbi:hypothetical protein Tco_0204911 [Tanacetum coccineum]
MPVLVVRTYNQSKSFSYPEDGVAGNCKFTREEWDAPYRPTFKVLTKEVFTDPAICKTIVDQFPTPGEMVRVEGLSDDQLTAKMSALHCMMMSHGGELLAHYRGVNQSHHEYVLSIDSKLKAYEEKLATSDASFAKSKAKGKERKNKIKSLSKSLDNLHFEVARLSAALNQATILEAESMVQGELLYFVASARFEHGLSMHQTKDEFADISKYAAEPLSVILQIELEKLVCPASILIPRDTCVSPPIAKESTVTPVPKSLELPANVDPVSSAVASEQNEEHVNVMVDGSDLEMADGAAPSKSRGVFVQGVSHVLDDVVEAMAVESECVSSIPTDVVVALSIGGKGDGSVPSSTVE